MRDILFRAKERYSGAWVYGALLKDNVFTYILSGNPKVTMGLQVTKEVAEVLPETVGQFTGLTDKNGTMIFEGDIVKYAEGVHHWSGAYETPTLVEYDCGGFYPFAGEGEYAMSSEYAIIIGNIHDNPELLGGK